MRHLETEDILLLASLAATAIAVLVDEVVNSTVFKVLKILGLLVSVAFAVVRIRTAKPFYRDIAAPEWAAVGSEYEFRIVRSEHGRGRYPVARCLVPDGHDGYAECFIDPVVAEDGTVVVRNDQPAAVRIEVRK